MLASGVFIPLLQTVGSWTVQFGPWNLPPQAWMPATAVIGAIALRTRSRSLAGRGLSDESPGETDAGA